MDSKQPLIRILHVEDDDDHALMTRISLTRLNPAFSVENVPNGAECLDKVGAETYAVALVDYMLPGMNGLDILKKIKAVAPTLPVVIMTGYEDTVLAQQAKAAGADGFVLKRGLNYFKDAHRVIMDILATTDGIPQGEA